MYQFNFDFNAFLKTYWHKKPVIIKQGFKDFIDPIEPDEVAGLAMEEEIDSRFVTCLNKEWEAKHGPFAAETFETFPETHSQLIVQAANHWHQGARELTEPFRVLPNWLFDDLMICLSMPEGGVGPHIDQYDVFIIQGMGKRRWRVGDKGDYQETNLHTGLRQITGFEPIIDDILMPGDILYIPPGFPHEGNTIDISLSYSMGYRSPKPQELLSGFADYVISNELGNSHYHDESLAARNTHGAILAAEYQKIDDMLMRLVNDEQAKATWLGEQLSQSRHELDIMPADPLWQSDELYQFLQDGLALEKVSGLRALYHENNLQQVFINGESIALPRGAENVAKALCDNEFFTIEHIGDSLDDPATLALLLALCNQGFWYPQA